MKKSGKLVVRRETLRDLSALQLRRVVAGVVGSNDLANGCTHANAVAVAKDPAE